jgi:hypothetical protein
MWNAWNAGFRNIKGYGNQAYDLFAIQKTYITMP